MLLDFIGLLKKRPELLFAGWFNLVLGAVTAVVAVASGYAALRMQHIPLKGLIGLHFKLAVASTICMLIMVALRLHRHEKMNLTLRVVYYVLAFLGLAMISYAGHLGGVWVHGQ